MAADIHELSPRSNKANESAGLNAQHKQALMTLAYTFICQQQHNKAFVIFRALSELFSSDVYLKTWLIYSLMSLGKFTEALALAEETTEELNTRADSDLIRAAVYLLKSKTLWRLGHSDEARIQMREHLKILSIS